MQSRGEELPFPLIVILRSLGRGPERRGPKLPAQSGSTPGGADWVTLRMPI